jgi:hypothetical protein
MSLEQEIDDDIDISKFWGCSPLGLDMPFVDNDTCAEGGVIYFCQDFFLCMMPSMDG